MQKIRGNNLKLIAVKGENYDRLKRLGYTSESFNDVITRLLEAGEDKLVQEIVRGVVLERK